MRSVIKARATLFLVAMSVAATAVLVLGAAAQGDKGGGGSTPSPIVYTKSHQPLLIQGYSDLSSSSGGGGDAAVKPATSLPQAGSPVTVPLRLPPRASSSANALAPLAAGATHDNGSGYTPITPGEPAGFPGITGPQQAAVNGYDLEPPDQGLCVGPAGGGGGGGDNTASQTRGDKGGNAMVMEIINNALQAFSPSGKALSPVIPTTQLFALPKGTFLSDPRCYWDRDTQRWFFTEFELSNPATQYIAVSQTSNPLGKYTVFKFDTTDAGNGAAGCPCYGDFDQLGADANGVYLSTNEFSDNGSGPNGGFNGTDIWAMSKWGLANAADGGPIPVLDRYAVTADAFGLPYHVAPSQTPPDGSYAQDTEYFVESNSDANADNHLLVYDMGDTHVLASGGFPTLAASELTSEAYAFPPNATQKPGGSAPPGTTLNNDFNAIQEVTYTAHSLYAELDTASPPIYPPPPSATSGIGWFIIGAEGGNSVSMDNQGYVTNRTDNFLYPDIAVNGSGNGYLDFSVSGPNWFPSPGYVAFDSKAGAHGKANLPAIGADDENGFTCYPTYGGPPCRWGDYSMGVAYQNAIYMATEWIPPTPRDAFVNWGTYIWSLPASNGNRQGGGG